MSDRIDNSNASGTRVPARTLLVYALLTAASVVMLFLALPGIEQWYLAFVALVPLFLILQHAPARRAVLIFWLAGFLFSFLAVHWLSLLSAIGWVMLSFYLSLYFAAFAVVARVISSGRPHIPFVLSAPITWVGLDMLRAVLLGGFPWLYLGHDLYRRIAFIQVADLAGVYVVTFVVVTVNAWAARIIYLGVTGRLRQARQPLHAILGALWCGMLLAGTLYYGAFRIREFQPVGGPRISVVQGNIPQDLKEYLSDSVEEARRKMQVIRDTYYGLTEPLMSTPGRALPDDLVAWPETIVPPLEGWVIEKEETGKIENKSAQERAWVREIRHQLGRPFLTGSVKYELVDGRLCYFNAAYYFPTDNGPFDVYLKLHLVPFGEYIPIREVPWINRFLEWFLPEGYEANLTAGSRHVLFVVKDVPFATPICYEDTMPDLIRSFTRRGARFMVNLTNDGWFGDTIELDEHMANSVFRTVENRVGLARSANTGISCFVDPLGQITSIVKDKEGRYREVAGVLTDQVILDDRRTFYTRHGDIFGWVMAGWIPLFLLLRLGRHWVERDRIK